jgi:hypothetical protein
MFSLGKVHLLKKPMLNTIFKCESTEGIPCKIRKKTIFLHLLSPCLFNNIPKVLAISTRQISYIIKKRRNKDWAE